MVRTHSRDRLLVFFISRDNLFKKLKRQFTKFSLLDLIQTLYNLNLPVYFYVFNAL